MKAPRTSDRVEATVSAKYVVRATFCISSHTSTSALVEALDVRRAEGLGAELLTCRSASSPWRDVSKRSKSGMGRVARLSIDCRSSTVTACACFTCLFSDFFASDGSKGCLRYSDRTQA